MEYVQLYPEYDFIFLGDNGQGDAMCADRVIEKAGMLRHNLKYIGCCAACSILQSSEWFLPTAGMTARLYRVPCLPIHHFAPGS